MLSARATHSGIDTQYPTKTPARVAKLRSENVYNQGTMTIHNGKGKPNSLIRTPFQPKTVQPRRLLKEGFGLTKTPITLFTRPLQPLADKTPFANRVLNIYNTPAPDQKPAKLTTKVLESHGPSPENGSARASSTRKHSRAPTSATKNYQTPANQGNYWDISDDAIAAPEIEQVQEPIDDHDEIEYAPPNTLNLSYQPPFDFELPDYKALGKEILRNVYCHPCEETLPPTYDFHIGDNEFMNWDTLSLPSLDTDDESSHPAKRAQVISKSSRTASSRRAPPGTSSRPATSASVRPPIKRSASISVTRPRSTTSATTTLPKPRSNPTTTLTTRKNAAAIPAAVTTARKQLSTIRNAIPPTTAQSTTRPSSRPATSASTRPPFASTLSSRIRATSTSKSTVKPIVRSTTSSAAPVTREKKPMMSCPPLATGRSTAAVPGARKPTVAARALTENLPAAASGSSLRVTKSQVSDKGAPVRTRAKNAV